MEERTREYLRGRFRDYYRSADVSPPPDANEREWGYIPWTAGGGTTMVRHQSWLDLTQGAAFTDALARTAPRHAYFSAARYDDPGASTMGKKAWRNADLVFDLDADHLPGVDAEETSYAEMLEACKGALERLLSFLEDEFAFEDVTVVFSGGRGYHVHVRDESVRGLESDARREIVDFVRGIDLEADDLIRRVSVEGTNQRVLATGGGWGRRVHRALVEFADELTAAEQAEALERLQQLDGIGEGRAKTVLGAFQRNPDAVQEGNLEAGGPGIRRLVEALVARERAAQGAPIDEPVTTDTRRLIRLPGSLHGGTGFRVTPIPREALASFDPLVDAVADRFRGREISIRLEAESVVELGGETYNIPAGESYVPEAVGVFLMAGGDAEKATEQ
ncbi:Eukaryotic-type DNA primase, catalytic (small) subunit [Halalkaliarchaeum sp. AArc-CO]|uniref:DNA primase small subunit PriS n=1 Tax=unclassified Halalkaliarchaeum TaxID=2678344 RepID=UPI00217EA0A3|nr:MULTISPECIES: DNA primase small subunit PriS [unclassified Halalkaliarchaeum]MDR5672960.1 DNA primase small subunit PriS [Halalkaliarchaeum sp. AArc-GB]UWG50303.1 Eukaryotic-type DNA primase, catalytic (small) subunit [Halalkaliarchaeum sp. AArc-CO]